MYVIPEFMTVFRFIPKYQYFDADFSLERKPQNTELG